MLFVLLPCHTGIGAGALELCAHGQRQPRAAGDSGCLCRATAGGVHTAAAGQGGCTALSSSACPLDGQGPAMTQPFQGSTLRITHRAKHQPALPPSYTCAGGLVVCQAGLACAARAAPCRSPAGGAHGCFQRQGGIQCAVGAGQPGAGGWAAMCGRSCCKTGAILEGSVHVQLRS